MQLPSNAHTQTTTTTDWLVSIVAQAQCIVDPLSQSVPFSNTEPATTKQLKKNCAKQHTKRHSLRGRMKVISTIVVFVVHVLHIHPILGQSSHPSLCCASRAHQPASKCVNAAHALHYTTPQSTAMHPNQPPHSSPPCCTLSLPPNSFGLHKTARNFQGRTNERTTGHLLDAPTHAFQEGRMKQDRSVFPFLSPNAKPTPLNDP